MKKVLIRSLITALVINMTGAIINLVSFFANGTFLLAQQINGGEYTGWRGFGLLLSRIISYDPVHNPNVGRTSISLDLQNWIQLMEVYAQTAIFRYINSNYNDNGGISNVFNT